MRILFVHQNFPAQYKHVAVALKARGHDVRALTVDTNKQPEIVETWRYSFDTKSLRAGFPIAGRFTEHVARADTVGRAALKLKESGYSPEVISGHLGWGETLFLKEVWPEAKLIVYAEFYYTTTGGDVGFDAEFETKDPTSAFRTVARQASLLLAMETADRGLAPTKWQASRFPESVRGKIEVIFDGIDTARCSADPAASITLGRDKAVLKPGDEVITFVNRNLEPYRGYHIFMRTLPQILAARPKARAIIVGADGVSYGAAPPQGKKWKDIFLAEVKDKLDMSRVHFVGHLPYETYLKVIQVSAAHVYLTYPFVLSWSMLESMSMEALIIGSRTPPVEELIRHNENGILVDFFDQKAIADAVISALAEPEKYRHLRKAARQTILDGYDLLTVCLPQQIRLIEGAARSPSPKGRGSPAERAG